MSDFTQADLLQVANERIATLEAQLAEAREALEEARFTFAGYAEMHQRKLSRAVDATDRKFIMLKVMRNQDMCDLMQATLSKIGDHNG